MMTPAEIQAVPAHFLRYVEHVKNQELIAALRESGASMQDLLQALPEAKGDHRYAEGKWSIKEVINHLMDAERIFCYRALRFARNDGTELHGFEENDYAPEANAHARTVKQLAGELARLRATTIDLFSSFTPQMLLRKGKANKAELQVKTLGYIVAGRDRHHLGVLRERYLK